MPPSIEELLHRRTDLSTFLVHFTRHYEGRSARQNLLGMLRDGYLKAKNAYGMGRGQAEDDERFQRSQRVVCFTETPLEHAWMMCSDIEGREFGFDRYALAFSKVWARSQHVNPVWYLDISARGGSDWLTVPVGELREAAASDAKSSGRSLAEYPIASLLPFIEQMGPTTVSRKEFWWEREWRHVGHFQCDWPHIVAVFAPEQEHQAIADELGSMAQPSYAKPPLLDTNWGLERMISALRGVPASEAGPLPPLP